MGSASSVGWYVPVDADTGALPIELRVHVEDPARLELATYGTWPDTGLAGAAMMRKLERYNDEYHEDHAEAEAALLLLVYHSFAGAEELF